MGQFTPSELERIDSAIAQVLADPGSPTDMELAATGEPGLERVVDLYYHRGENGPPFPPMTFESATERGDAWSQALSVVGTANPRAFMDMIDSGRVPFRPDQPYLDLTVVQILGSIDDPRASDMVRRLANHPDFLVRSNLIRALAATTTSRVAREVVEHALSDPNIAVQMLAIEGICSQSPERALQVYQEFSQRTGIRNFELLSHIERARGHTPTPTEVLFERDTPPDAD